MDASTCPMHDALSADVQEIKSDVKAIRTRIDTKLTLHEERINTHQKLLYGACGVILTGVLAGLMSLILLN